MVETCPPKVWKNASAGSVPFRISSSSAFKSASAPKLLKVENALFAENKVIKDDYDSIICLLFSYITFRRNTFLSYSVVDI